MILDRFFQDYITALKDEIEDCKEGLCKAEDFNKVKNLQGRIDGLQLAIKHLQNAIEKQQTE